MNNHRKVWELLVAGYNLRRRQWVMEVLPTMSDREWKEYEAWVAGFGAPHLKGRPTNTTRQYRKVRRRLRTAKKKKEPAPTFLNVHNVMRFTMGMPAHADGVARTQRATRPICKHERQSRT